MRSSGERPLLALDSATRATSVAVGSADGILAEMSVAGVGRHSATLLPIVDRCMRAAGLEARGLGGIIVGSGPGSFTGLRIAGATAKGIARALDVPLYAYSSLLAVAAQAWSCSRPVCAMFDARHRDVYAAAYRFGGEIETIHPPVATTLDEIMGRYGRVEPPLFIGDAADRHREELVAAFGDVVAPPHVSAPRAAALIWLACAFPATGLVGSPEGWEPSYLRESGAERIAAARAASMGVE